MVYVVKATWAGMVQAERIARSLDEAEQIVLGMDESEGIRGCFLRGGYDHEDKGVMFAPKVLCVDILYDGKILKSYNFSR